VRDCPLDDLRRLALREPHAWLLVSARYFQTLDFYAEYLDCPTRSCRTP
jgi:hypothetical protein